MFVKLSKVQIIIFFNIQIVVTNYLGRSGIIRCRLFKRVPRHNIFSINQGVLANNNNYNTNNGNMV